MADTQRYVAITADGRRIEIEVRRCQAASCSGFRAWHDEWRGPCEGAVDMALHAAIGESRWHVTEVLRPGEPTRTELLAALAKSREYQMAYDGMVDVEQSDGDSFDARDRAWERVSRARKAMFAALNEVRRG